MNEYLLSALFFCTCASLTINRVRANIKANIKDGDVSITGQGTAVFIPFESHVNYKNRWQRFQWKKVTGSKTSPRN